MAFYDKFPYTNFQEINLDRLIQELIKVKEGLDFVIENASLKYADPIQWNITHQYQANTVVIDPATGTAYISTQPVPDNVMITDTNYWTPIFDLSALFTQYKAVFTENIEAGTTASVNYVLNDLVWCADVLYRITQPVSAGGTIASGTNAEPVSMEDLFKYVLDRIADTNTAISDEVTAREDADTILQTAITDEETARIQAINNITNQLAEMYPTYKNVKTYGAVGDGMTDDTAAIQAAFNDGVGMYYFPAGTYVVSSTLNVPSGVSIIGDGTASEIETHSASDDIIKLYGSRHIIRDIMICTGVSRNSSAFALTTDQNAYGENIALENVNIFRASNNESTGSGIYITDQSKIWMVNGLKIEMRGGGHAIRITAGNDRFFSNCWLRGSYIAAPTLGGHGQGIRIDGSTGDFFQNIDVVQFDSDLVITTNNDPIQVLKFNQCLFDSSKSHTVNIYNNEARIMHCVTFNACWFGGAGFNETATTTGNGVALVNYQTGTTRDISFTNCTFHNNRCAGLYVLNQNGAMDGIKVTGCSFEENGSSTASATFNDVDISNINSCIVTDNMFNRHGQIRTTHNIVIGGYSVVTGNVCHSVGDNIQQNGTGNAVANNINH